MLTPGIGAPGQQKVIPLPPEFSVPQAGQDKQECENAAANRGLRPSAQFSRATGITVLGDELYSHHPLCEGLSAAPLPFILVCKPASHPTLYEQLVHRAVGKDLHHVSHRYHPTKGLAIDTDRYAPQLPLRTTADAVHGKWCELTVTTAQGTCLSHKAFVTQEPIPKKNVASLVAAGRTRWKVENEHNTTLKTTGYHWEHTFGHGQPHLAALLATCNLLAVLLHTLLDLLAAKYRLRRRTLVSRKTFFDDLRALTRYLCFASWAPLLDFRLQGLEVALPLDST